MPDAKGEKLFVNLGTPKRGEPAQGIRARRAQSAKSAGRHRAVIVHTATGRHLAELEAQFADVGVSATETDFENTFRRSSRRQSNSGVT